MAFGLITCALVVGVLGAVGWVIAVADSAPNISELKPRVPNPPTVVFAADGTRLGFVHAPVIYTFEAGNRIPQVLKEATVAIEDRRFYHHGALDYQGILRAGIKDVFGGGTTLQGASTLTMQLVDNMYLPQNIRRKRDLKYKITQAKLALQLENKHTKNWILDTYLNDAPYGTVDGETARGVGAASEIFFNKPVQKLDLAQMALLAGLPQAPSDYNPFLDPAAARARRHDVLVAMMRAGYITRPQAVVADHQPLQVQRSAAYSGTPLEPYIFDYVVKQLQDRYGSRVVQNGGLKVYTTIDPKVEQEAQNAVDDRGRVTPAPPGTAAALASVDPATGHIVALAATENYAQSKFFYPVQAQRQTGSAAKVFALMTLIHDYDGDPNQTYYTSKQLTAGWDPSAPTWTVHTDTNTYAGTISVAKATTISDNTVFAQLVVDLGVNKFEAVARSMGLPASQMIGAPAEVLGGWKNGITMLQMAAADAVLANGGTYRPPTIIDRVVFPDGHVDNWGNPPAHQVFSSGETYAATQVLKTVIQSGTGTAANYGCPAAGKTGTAENLANAWFVGYTPKLATAVWVGYPRNNISLGPNGFGGTMAAPLWKIFMQSASNGFCGDFPPPTTFWTGTAFFGNYSATGKAGNCTSTGSSSSNSSSNTNPTTTCTTGGGSGANNYNNPTYYAQPPQPPAGQPTGGKTGGGKSGGGKTGGGGTGGTGGGKSGGGGGGTGGGHGGGGGGGGHGGGGTSGGGGVPGGGSGH